MKPLACAGCGTTDAVDPIDRTCPACITAKAGPPISDPASARQVGRLIHQFSGRGSSVPPTSAAGPPNRQSPARAPKPRRRKAS